MQNQENLFPVVEKTMIPIGKTFGVKVPKEAAVPGMTPGHKWQDRVPAREPHTFELDFLRDMAAFIGMPKGDGDSNVLSHFGDGLLLTGPTGCGKTTGVLQYAARVNWPVIRVNGHRDLLVSDLIGSKGLRASKAGGTRTMFEYGPLAIAMMIGALFVLDEMDLIDAAVSAAINPVLEGGALVLAENEGEVIHPHPDFRFIATGNSAGGGDNTGSYHGVVTQNLAYMDRFQVVKVDYLPKDVEKAIIVDKLGEAIPEPCVDAMIDVANDVRGLFKSGEIPVTFSTRTLLRWGVLTANLANTGAVKGKFRYALQRALTNRAPEDVADAIDRLGASRFNGESGSTGFGNGFWEGKQK